MDKRELQQIPGLIKEIEFLKKQIEYAEIHAEAPYAVDVVKGSSKYFPYGERTFKVEGIDWKGYDKKVKRLKAQLQRRLDELMDKVAEAQEYIAGVEDSRTRMVLQCRFINGLTYEQIEAETGITVITAKRIYKKWRVLDK